MSRVVIAWRQGYQACSLATKAFPPALVTLLPYVSCDLSDILKFAEWLGWSVNTELIAPAGQSSHFRDGKSPEAASSPQSSAVIARCAPAQWKAGHGTKTIIAAIVLVVTQSLKWNIGKDHFIMFNRSSIMCKNGAWLDYHVTHRS